MSSRGSNGSFPITPDCEVCVRRRSRCRGCRRYDSIDLYLTRLAQSAKERAKKRGLDYTIDSDWVIARYTGRCEATGIRLRLPRRGPQEPYSPSLDRIDSSQGYTPDNCRIVCWAFNRAVGEWGDEVFSFVAQRFLENNRII